jgi:hypothetical protein
MTTNLCVYCNLQTTKYFSMHFNLFLILSDSSSGYDSTDLSDAESVTSWKSHDSLLGTEQERSNNHLPANDKAEMMSFHSTHALSEHLKLILAMPEMCDVTFLVGPREVPVHGVRAIMGTRSR